MYVVKCLHVYFDVVKHMFGGVCVFFCLKLFVVTCIQLR